jgi:hypothetical protein
MGVKELEKLNTKEGVSITDVVREILEYRQFGKRPCGLCKGFRFVDKTKAKKFLKGKNSAKGKKAE